MCNYKETIWACKCETKKHTLCNAKENAEYPHFLRCRVVETRQASREKCPKCSLMLSRASRSATTESKTASLSSPSTWKHMRFGMGKKKGIKKENIKLVMKPPEPVFRRQMFASSAPQPVAEMQPDSEGLAIDPMRSHRVVDRSSEQRWIQESAAAISTRPNKETGRCFENGHSAPKMYGALNNANQTLHGESHQLNQEAADNQSTKQIGTKTSGLGQDVQDKNQDPKPKTPLADQYLNEKPLPPLPVEAQFDTSMQNSRWAISRSQPQQREANLTGLIPELQRHASHRPPIDNDRLSDNLNAIATRRPPHQPLSKEDKEALDYARSTEAYRGVPKVTAAALQQVDTAFDPAGSQVPGCLIPGFHSQPTPAAGPVEQIPSRLSPGHRPQPVTTPQQTTESLPSYFTPGNPPHRTPASTPAAVKPLPSGLHPGRPRKPTHPSSANERLTFNAEKFAKLSGHYDFRKHGDRIPTLEAPRPTILRPRPGYEQEVPLNKVTSLASSAATYSTPRPRTSYVPYNPQEPQLLTPALSRPGTPTAAPSNVRLRTAYVPYVPQELPPLPSWARQSSSPSPLPQAPIQFSHRAATGWERYDPNSPPPPVASLKDHEEKDLAEAQVLPLSSENSVSSEGRGPQELPAQPVLPPSLSTQDNIAQELIPVCIRCTAPKVPSLENLSELDFDGTALDLDSE